MPTESFFNFFSPPKPPTDDDDDNVPEDIEERLELDYQLGEDIKEKLIPHAIDWFTGEALQFEEIPDEVDQDEFGGDEDEDEEDDDDDDRRSDNAEEESDEEVRSTYPIAYPICSRSLIFLGRRIQTKERGCGMQANLRRCFLETLFNLC